MACLFKFSVVMQERKQTSIDLQWKFGNEAKLYNTMLQKVECKEVINLSLSFSFVFFLTIRLLSHNLNPPVSTSIPSFLISDFLRSYVYTFRLPFKNKPFFIQTVNDIIYKNR